MFTTAVLRRVETTGATSGPLGPTTEQTSAAEHGHTDVLSTGSGERGPRQAALIGLLVTLALAGAACAPTTIADGPAPVPEIDVARSPGPVVQDGRWGGPDVYEPSGPSH